jgi:SAM-dependent methyltransferase
VNPTAVEKQGSWEEAVKWLRDQPEKRGLVLEAYYDDPLVEAATRYWQSEEWGAIRQWLPAVPGRALDVGAGRGTAAIASLANDAGLPIEVCRQRSERLPYPDGHFDVVFARAALHHIRDLAAAIREFHRVLKPGGRMIAVREHVISRAGDLQAFLDRHPLHSLYGGENALLLDDYVRAIVDAGFKMKRVIRPLDSVMNTAPLNENRLQREIGRRVGRHVPGAAACIAGLFRIPGVWPLARTAMSLADNRPGRLYSFMAVRP